MHNGRAQLSGRHDSGATRVPGVVAWIIQHVGGLEPDEAAIRAGERERLASSIDGSAPDRVVERDPFVPALPLLVPAEWAGDAGSPTLQEVEDGWLLRHSHRNRSAPASGPRRSRSSHTRRGWAQQKTPPERGFPRSG